MKIAIATGGGDGPGLNAVIRTVAKAASKRGWETLGILGGHAGLLEPQRVIPLGYRRLGGLPIRGGTILGTANNFNHFTMRRSSETAMPPACGSVSRPAKLLKPCL